MHVIKLLRLSIVTTVLVITVVAPAALLHGADAEAIPGERFGVGRATFTLNAADTQALDRGELALVDEERRVFYPVFAAGTFRRLLGQVLGANASDLGSSVTAYFLFSGERPLRLTLHAATPQHIAVTPQEPRRQPERAYARLLDKWWREYNAAAQKRVEEGDYPPLVDTYLTTMLGRRLGLEPPLLSRLNEEQADELQQTLELLLGVEKLRAATMRETMLRRADVVEVADRPVPPDIAWLPRDVPPAAPDVTIEPMAMHVPEECFYIRFGTFDNYIWLDHLMKEIGDDIGQSIAMRGHDTAATERQQKQLAVRQSKVGELLGGQVIEDVAMIGRDLYMREGAAFGLLFHAKSNLLGNDFTNQRKAALKEEEKNGATLETVKIAGRDVSFLSTPDNRLRSFYAVDGKFHLITTSQEIVRRFFEASEGRGALGASPEFRHARTLMPTSREDTVFAYFSSAFFRSLVSPQYQIELVRRVHAVTNIELVLMARMAARAEGSPSETIDDLIAGGFLPPGFGRTADGSGAIVEDSRVIDSMRGARGSFTPIPDVDLRTVTRSEAAWYATRAAFYADNWQQMDPLMVGAKRYSLDKKGEERIVIDANVSPFGEEKYGWIMSILDEPMRERIASAPNDIVTLQASVKGGLLFPTIAPHHLFVGIQDDRPPATDLNPTNFLKTLQILRTTPGYLGSWPKLGFLDLLPFGLAGEPDPLGFTQLPFGLWRWQGGGFSVLSFDQERLADISPHLRPVETENAAQVRVHVGDLGKSNLADWLSSMNYQRALATSQGNTRMLHALSQQLHVPRDKALETAEELLDVKLVCALGGQYRPVENADGHVVWQSTAWSDGPTSRRPADYRAPSLEWFRGLNAELTKDGGRMILHAEFDMQRAASEPKITLPSFNLFGSKKDKDDAAEEEKKPVSPRRGREF